MITLLSKTDDIFETKAVSIVNPVNCVGVMGKGLAKEIYKRYPNLCNEYFRACKNNLMNPGDVILEKDLNENKCRYILHLATKKHWKDPSQISWIKTGLKNLTEILIQNNLESVAVPAIGCGLGGLPWKEVLNIIYQYNTDKLNIYIYPPRD